MALCAIRNIVPCCEREKAVVYIVSSSPIKGIRAVACRTIGRKSGILMIRVRGCIKVIDMAVDTVISDPVELQGCSGGMTVCTTDGSVCTQKGKPIFLVEFCNIVHEPVGWSVAAGAVVAYGHPVDIRVAIHTLCVGFLKNQGYVAGPAICVLVLTRQRECCGVMVEPKCVSINTPIFRGVALRAIDPEFRTVRGLCLKRKPPPKQ